MPQEGQFLSCLLPDSSCIDYCHIFYSIYDSLSWIRLFHLNKRRQTVNLLGRLATISSGNARPGFSTQARVRDEYGQLHYVQVEPEFGELEFQSQIILIREKHYIILVKKFAFPMRLFSPSLSSNLFIKVSLGLKKFNNKNASIH